LLDTFEHFKPCAVPPNYPIPSSKLSAHFMLDIVRELTLDITSIRASK